jgi:hypothetical protein
MPLTHTAEPIDEEDEYKQNSEPVNDTRSELDAEWNRLLNVKVACTFNNERGNPTRYAGIITCVDTARAAWRGGDDKLFQVTFIADGVETWYSPSDLKAHSAISAHTKIQQTSTKARGVLDRALRRSLNRTHRTPARTLFNRTVRKAHRMDINASPSHVRAATRTIERTVKIPKTFNDVLRIDAQEGNSNWADATAKRVDQTKELGVFELIPEGETIPDDFQQVRVTAIYDVRPGEKGPKYKMRFAARGDLIDCLVPTYASVVRTESLKMILTLAKKMKLDILTGDCSHAYLNAPCAEKVWTYLPPEYGPLAGKRAYIVKALDGLGSSGRAWRILCAIYFIEEMGFKSAFGDDSVFMRFNQATGLYDFIVLYVDDFIIASNNCEEIAEKIRERFPLSNLGPLSVFLGMEYEESDGVLIMHATRYTMDVIADLEADLEHPIRTFDTPMASNYVASDDVTSELNHRKKRLYQALIGTAQWLVTNVRYDIAYAVGKLASHANAPREGHLKAAWRLFGYLKKFPDVAIPIDPTEMNIDRSGGCCCSDELRIYDTTLIDKEIPSVSPMQDSEMHLTAYVDAGLDCPYSTTGYIIYWGSTPISWRSKLQRTVATSSFASEFTAISALVQRLREYRYTLRSFGSKVTVPVFVFEDNMSVVQSSTLEKAVLKARHNLFSFHSVREAEAGGVLTVAHIATHSNLADIFTKALPRHTFNHLCNLISFDRSSLD